jgi:putative PIN family toxin of toxin-antitoxin system
MSEPTYKVVYDCNVFLQALGNPVGPAGQCVEEAFNRRVTLFIDDALLAELVDVAGRPEIARKLRFLPSRAAEFIEDLKKVAVFKDHVPAVFAHERDPDDAHYVNLALAAEASLIVSRDNDLLGLMNEKTMEGQTFQARFPNLRILNPVAYLIAIRTHNA